jgi:hypothetical protein
VTWQWIGTVVEADPPVVRVVRRGIRPAARIRFVGADSEKIIPAGIDAEAGEDVVGLGEGQEIGDGVFRHSRLPRT